MRTAAAVLLLVLLGACTTSRPTADAVEPAMAAAVRALAGSAEVRHDLAPRCGPTDAPLEGMHLQLVAEPATTGDLSVAVTRLTEQGLDVVSGDGRYEPLVRAVPDDAAWEVTAWPVEGGGLQVVATAEVDDASQTPQRPVTQHCG